MSFRVKYVGQSPDNIGEKELWVFKTDFIMKILLGIAVGFIACVLWIYYRWTKD